MKVTLLLLIGFLLQPATGFSQKTKLKKNPPGTVQVNDSLYVDVTEIANVEWREYLHYLLDSKDTLAYEQALPDTNVWDADTILNSRQMYYSFRHPGFNSYPVVGVSYEQANEFCKWRTYVANFVVYITANDFKDWKLHLSDSFPILYYYRLPTAAEWETIAAGKYSTEQYPYGYPDVYVKWKGKQQRAFNCNYKSQPYPAREPVYSFYTSPTGSFFKNSSGIKNMIGNVAEMVAEKGVAKGGSFFHQLEDCKIVLNQQYEKPERWLGFRCVAIKID